MRYHIFKCTLQRFLRDMRRCAFFLPIIFMVAVSDHFSIRIMAVPDLTAIKNVHSLIMYRKNGQKNRATLFEIDPLER